MKHDLASDSTASSTFPLIVLFGVLLAWLMAFLFITLYNQQLDTMVDEQAGALADDLARTAFTSLSGGQPILDLPRDLGGSPYTIEVQVDNTNSIFVVKVTGGRRAGNSYSALVNATVTIENQDFTPGGRVYFMRSGDQIVVSAAPIKAPVENEFRLRAEELAAQIRALENWSTGSAINFEIYVPQNCELDFADEMVVILIGGEQENFPAGIPVSSDQTFSNRRLTLRLERTETGVSVSEATGEPPEFYSEFARHRDNQPEATAIAAAYFKAREDNPEKNNIDISGYARENENSLLVQVTSIEENFIMRVTGRVDKTVVGKVENAWVVENIENISGDIKSLTPCPSPANAYRSGWLYSSRDALDHLRSRTWRRTSDNVVVAVPSNASIQAAAVTTNVWTYPAWRVTFENYVIFYQMMPWYEEENMPGFVFQSDPTLYPVV